MFEKEIKFISDFTINKINNLGSYFTYDELFYSGVNPAILKFISAELDYRIYEDRKKLLHHSTFNYSGSEIARYFDLIGKEIKKSTKISFNEIKNLVNQAIAFNADFIVSPNETLINLIFNKNQEGIIEDIKLKLNYVYYYPYIIDILNSYISKKKISGLTSSKLGEILSEINTQLSVSDPEKIIEDAVNTIFDFYNIGNTGNKKLSINFIEVYLEKMNLEKYVNKLKEQASRDPKQKYENNEIKSILFSPAPIKGPDKTVIEEPVIQEEQDLTKDEPKEEIDDVQNLENLPEDLTKSELQDEVQEESDQKEVEFDITEHNNLEALYNFNEESGENIPENENNVNVSKIEDEKIKEELKSSEEFELEKFSDAPAADKEPEKEHKKSRDKDIFTYLSDKEIEKIVGYIFNDDRDEFALTMEKVSECDTYEDAVDILKEVFKAYYVNPYSKEAITFTNSVANYFEQT